MKTISTTITAAVLVVASTAASAWGFGNNGYGNGAADGEFDGDFSFGMNFSGRGNGRGSSRYNDYNGYAPYGYAPYGYAPVATPLHRQLLILLPSK